MQVRTLVFGLLALSASGIGAEVPAHGPHPISFRIDEGQNINYFLRDGPVAAHLLLRSGTEPRILVAFPAGNGGVGLWFASTPTPINWTLIAPPTPFEAFDDE